EARLCEIEEPLAAILLAGLLLDEAALDELFQHTGEALLGNAQDIQQFGDRNAGMTADKVDDPMVGATEVIFHKNPVRLADEVPVSKEQKFYGFCQRGGFKGGLFAGHSPGG